MGFISGFKEGFVSILDEFNALEKIGEFCGAVFAGASLVVVFITVAALLIHFFK